MYCDFLRYFYVYLLDELQFSCTKDENLISMAVLVCRGECCAMLVYTCVCVWRRCLGVCALAQPEVDARNLSLSLSPLIFETGSLTGPEAYHVRRPEAKASQEFALLCPSVLGLHRSTKTSFHCGCWNVNIGTHADKSSCSLLSHFPCLRFLLGWAHFFHCFICPFCEPSQ